MKKILNITLMALALTLTFASCQKHREEGKMVVKLTDAPGDYQEVNVEVVGVEVHYEDDIEGSQQWVALDVTTGVYDLLELQNDVTALLADESTLPVGNVTQIRLILGDDNTVVIDNVVYPLELSSQDETGLKLNINAKVKQFKTMEIIIDFDAEQSIVEQGVGSYKLKPVLKVESLLYF